MVLRRKGQGRTKRNGVSLIIIPAIRSTRHWHISKAAMGLVGAVGLVLVLLAAAFVHHYIDIASDISELYQLRTIKRQQEARLKDLDRLTDELAARLRYLEVTDERIRTFLDEENLLPDGMEITSRENLSMERLWAVQAGSDAIGPTVPRNYHELSQVLSGMFQRSAEAEIRLENLYRVITHAADYFRARPSIWPVLGRVSSSYGMRRSPITGRWAFHHGIDIAANYGTEIRTTADGVVEFSGYNGLLGHCVIIDHGYGIKTLYAHNWRNLVRVDDWVERGEVIALVGSSGSSTGPHLHYEVWVEGERVDPWTYHLSASLVKERE